MSRARKVSVGVLAVIAASLVAGFAVFAAAVFTYDPHAPVSGDAVVVLTGGDLRVREGLRLFAAGAGRRILISGVNQSTTRKDLARHTDVIPLLFDCCVDVGQQALDTAGNAAETRAWLEPWGFQRLIVVTSNYHMPRSLLAFHRLLPGIELVPHAVVPSHYQPAEVWRHPGAIKLLVVEYLKSIPAAARLVISRATGLGAPTALPRATVREVSLQQGNFGGP